MSKNIFITGGTGFLGRRIIARLQKENFTLFGLARSEKSEALLASLNVKSVKGSLENIPEWESALKNTDVIIHCAAPVEFWGPWEKYDSGIVQATKNLYSAGENQNVKRFIYISSESVLQDKMDLVDIDETAPYPKEPSSLYGKSKMMAEQFILAQKSEMESIILRPTFIWGQGVQALETMIEKIESKDFMWINNGESSFEMVHVDNVAEATFLSIDKGEKRGIYYVTDDNPQPAKTFITKLLKTKEITPADKSIPKGLAMFAASTVEFIWNTFGISSDPMITRFDASFIAMARKYNIKKIKTDLGYSPIVSEAEGLAEMTKSQ